MQKTAAAPEHDHHDSSGLSVAEALHEAMTTPFSPDRAYVQSPRDLPAPEPHLPLRKASPRLFQQQSRRGAPRPLFAPTSSHNHVRGFNPSPVQAAPHIDNLTASSEHAFAAREEKGRRPFRMPPGVQALQQEPDMRAHEGERPGTSKTYQESPRPPSSPMMPPPSPAPSGRSVKLRSSKSLGDGLRGLKHRMSNHVRGKTPNGRDTPDSTSSLTPAMPGDEVRQSVRSALTSDSSLVNISSVNTEHSSLVTAHSSRSDFVHVPSWQDTEQPKSSFDVDDMIGMYEDGFESAKQSMDTQAKRSLQEARPSFMHAKRSFQEIRPSSAEGHRPPVEQKRPVNLHRRSQSAGLLNHVKPPAEESLAPPPPPNPSRSSRSLVTGEDLAQNGQSVQSMNQAAAAPPATVPRDRYGFKKISHHVTIEQYDAWDRKYSEHIERRTKKWQALMKQYGYDTEKPIRFPAKSDKVKRYVRKGIPPDWRGAAWFWYAGGPHILAKQPGLYAELLEQAGSGGLSDNDREHIERDLNRTFPDNVRFKPDPTTAPDAQSGDAGGKKRQPEPEMPIVQALRRVLQAFAVHSPSIGYCQSLNFIAGLLLLFLDSDEEKAFVLLNMVTSLHLPGTHGVTLEGANIDIAVLMSCVKDSLPGVWAKLDDQGGGPLGASGDETAQRLRLPTVSLATTAWFMSLFVGTLPIESVLRVWDCLFFEGSKTLFRVALSIFKAGERSICAVSDPMEVFQVVQTIPRGLLDVNSLMEVCFRRRGGFGHVSQDLVERRRQDRRREVAQGGARGGGLERLRGRFRRGTRA